MTLKELRKSISKFGNDDDNSQVVLITINADEEIEYSVLAFTGLFPKIPNCIALGSEEVAYKLIQDGKLSRGDFNSQSPE
jgi:hypothetical protein